MLRILFLMLFTSCQVYRSSFDCPPCEGIPCRSVTEIESMIVEAESGPDILIEKEPTQIVFIKKKECSQPRKKQERIWISNQKTASGYEIEGHYIYFSKEEIHD